MKKRTGRIDEEFVAITSHHFVDGEYKYTINDTVDGYYTGRIGFVYENGKGLGVKTTKWYRTDTMPKWMKDMMDSMGEVVL